METAHKQLGQEPFPYTTEPAFSLTYSCLPPSYLLFLLLSSFPSFFFYVALAFPPHFSSSLIVLIYRNTEVKDFLGFHGFIKKTITFAALKVSNLAIIKNEILLFVTTWTNPGSIILSEISQTEKDIYTTVSDMCGI